MRRLYSLLVWCALPVAFGVVLWRGFKDRGYWQALPQRFGFGKAQPRPTLWIHAVSLGEVSAAAPLIRALMAAHPDTPLVLSTATPAGRARALSLFGQHADIRFLPYDTAGGMRRFLRRVNPRVAIIMETELWPNLYRECRRRAIPVLLANARLSARSVLNYRRFAALFREVLSGEVLVAAQSAADAARFEDIGARGVRVAGNVKFDLPADAPALAQGQRWRAQIGERPVWIAGSTHAGEDEAVLDAHQRLLGVSSRALLILAPRHKERFEAVASLLQARGLPFVRRSGGQVPGMEVPVLLVDTLGELASLYPAADVAFVGGSLVPIGGHNLLEPAALGIPVLTGPHNSNGRDIAKQLIGCGAAREVRDAAELAAVLQQLLADAEERTRMGSAGRQMVAANRGTVQRLVDLIAPWWEADPSRAH